MNVIGTVFSGKGKEGDFEWQINSGKYEDALFIFNEDESRAKWKKAGRGNAVIRKYNKYAVDKPRSVGVLTGTKAGGYSELTEAIKSKIDECIKEIKDTIQRYGYKTIYYSSKTKNGLLGTSIFQVDEKVLLYITQELKNLSSFCASTLTK
jgi:hypothetical protein